MVMGYGDDTQLVGGRWVSVDKVLPTVGEPDFTSDLDRDGPDLLRGEVDGAREERARLRLEADLAWQKLDAASVFHDDWPGARESYRLTQWHDLFVAGYMAGHMAGFEEGHQLGFIGGKAFAEAVAKHPSPGAAQPTTKAQVEIDALRAENRWLRQRLIQIREWVSPS